MVTESASHALRYVEQLVHDGLGLFLVSKALEILRHDLDDVMGLHSKGFLHYPGKGMAACQGAPAGRACAAHAYDTRKVVVKAEARDYMLHLIGKLLVMLVFYHDEPMNSPLFILYPKIIAMKFRKFLLAGMAAACLGCGDRYPNLYDHATLERMDGILKNSHLYGNEIRLSGIYYHESSSRKHPLVVEKYFDDRRNSIYVTYERGRKEHEMLVQITSDLNGNDAIDGGEIAFEMMNIDSDLSGVERIGLQWRDINKRRHGINRTHDESGNEMRFRDADSLFRKIMRQAERKRSRNEMVI